MRPEFWSEYLLHQSLSPPRWAPAEASLRHVARHPGMLSAGIYCAPHDSGQEHAGM